MLLRLTASLWLVVLLASVANAAYLHGQNVTPAREVSADGDASSDTDVVNEVMGRLQSEAVDAPDDEKLLRGAVEGVLKATGDEHAAYYNREEFAAFNQMLDGEFSGVGLELQEDEGAIVVVRVLPGTPAERAGVEKGERIVSVDGKDVRSESIDMVVSMVKGEPGTEVTLGLTGGSAGRRNITMRRETIEMPTYEARVLDDGNGLIQLRQFTSGAGENVRTASEQLIAEGAQGIVLDLRGNPGGLLPEAINVASVFIEDGTVVSVEERGQDRESFDAEGDALESVPLVVLVDEFSASASEIVAGAVQDSDRGTVVGEPTYGKGTVQTIQRLDAGGGIKFTTAEYFTPSGDSIEGKGVTPDREAVDRLRTDRDEALAIARDALSELVAAAG